MYVKALLFVIEFQQRARNLSTSSVADIAEVSTVSRSCKHTIHYKDGKHEAILTTNSRYTYVDPALVVVLMLMLVVWVRVLMLMLVMVIVLDVRGRRGRRGRHRRRRSARARFLGTPSAAAIAVTIQHYLNITHITLLLLLFIT